MLPKIKFSGLILVSLLFLHLLILLITKFTAWPEMLTYPWLVTNGFRYYGDIVQPYLPLLTFMLKVWYSLFGLSTESLKVITWFVILISDVFIYKIAVKLYDRKKALISLFTFICLQIYFEGNGLWFELGSLPFILGAVYLLLINQKSQKTKLILFAGSLIGLAGLIKQTNYFYIFPAAVSVYRQPKAFIKLAIAIFLPLLILFIYYSTTDQFHDFLYWGLWHPLLVHNRMPGFILLPTIKQLLLTAFIFCPLLISFKRQKVLSIYFLVSLLFVISRFGYFHFQHTIGFFSLIIPAALLFNNRYSKIFLTIYFLVIIGLLSKFIYANYRQPIRFFDPEVMHIRQVLVDTVPGPNPVFFYNLSSEYYVGNRWIPSKPWAYEFPWYLEIPGIQEKVIKGIQSSQVSYVIFKQFGNEGKYIPGSYKPELIDNYIKNNFSYDRHITKDILLLKRK